MISMLFYVECVASIYYLYHFTNYRFWELVFALLHSKITLNNIGVQTHNTFHFVNLQLVCKYMDSQL